MKFKLNINIDDPGLDILGIRVVLEEISKVIEDGEEFGFVWDANGDRVGHFRVAD